LDLTTIKIKGTDAIRLLDEHRANYRATGQYPFLIGDANELGRVEESIEVNDEDPDTIIKISFGINTAEWIAQRKEQAIEDGLDPDSRLGMWPGEILDKGSIGLHKDVVTAKIKPEVHLGLVKIAEPWQLPAALKWGGWNDCPNPEIHCAFHRDWQERFGAEITGMSGDVVECAVKYPPNDQKTATILAWQQYWYCSDIIEQGVDSISNLAATLIHSPYWYFWWD
jgi:Domain of unknown function (DUF4253)